MDIEGLYRFISHHKYAVVSSTATDGTSQSALVGITVTPRLEIIFDTVDSSRKYKNLVERPSCSLVVGLDSEQTVQYEGTAALPQGPELEFWLEAYFAAWPDGRNRLNWPGIAHFVIAPRWIRYSDYGHSPPLIEEFGFPADRVLESYPQ